jgi:hypothetical protein
MQFIYEPDLPKGQFHVNGAVKKMPDYRELYNTHGPDTMVKVANNIGGFTFKLGSNLHETFLNRKCGQALYAQRKAQSEVNIAIVDRCGVDAVNLINELNPNKRNRAEAESLSDYVEESSECPSSNDEDEDIKRYTDRITLLENALRELCARFNEDPMYWGVL